MRYGSLVVSAAVLLGLAACKGNDAGMNDDLAKDLNAAKSADPLALAPHAGVQTIVSAEELSPQGRAQLRSSRKSTHLVARHHAFQQAPVQTEEATTVAPLPAATASTEVVAATPTTVVQTPAVINAQPKPAGPETTERDNGGGGGGGSGIGGILGAIGSAILRGGAVDGDHCDPRGHHGILINQRGPILRGTY
jgi:hypothetical protein